MWFFGDFQPFHVIFWSHPTEKQPIYDVYLRKSAWIPKLMGWKKVTNYGFNYGLFGIFPGGFCIGMLHPSKDAGSFTTRMPERTAASRASHQHLYLPKPFSNTICQLPWNPKNSYGCFRKLGVTPKSSILIGLSVINHPFWGTLIFGNTQRVWKKTFLFNYGILVCSPIVQPPNFSEQNGCVSCLFFLKQLTFRSFCHLNLEPK